MNRKLWYSIIGAAVVVCMTITGASIYQAKQAEKEQAMMFELNQLRTAVTLYKTTFQKNPSDLETALSAKYAVPVPEWSAKRDDTRRVLDPFGSPYEYMADNGWVRSTTNGYESW